MTMLAFIKWHVVSIQDLYSQYYEEIGVLFAACPNFTDHYTEDAISKDGLEWMRVLNEILSDYDDLLNNPNFKGNARLLTGSHAQRMWS